MGKSKADRSIENKLFRRFYPNVWISKRDAAGTSQAIKLGRGYATFLTQTVMYLLDTNVCIDWLKGQEPLLLERVQSVHLNQLKIPAIVEAELFLGAEKSNHRAKVIENLERFLKPLEVLPFESRIARQYAVTRAELERRGKIIGPNDLIIAATALVHRAILVTRNTKEFQRVQGLQTQDWTRS